MWDFLCLKSYQPGRKNTFCPRCSGIGTLTFFPSQGANVGRGRGPEDLKSSQKCCWCGIRLLGSVDEAPELYTRLLSIIAENQSINQNSTKLKGSNRITWLLIEKFWRSCNFDNWLFAGNTLAMCRYIVAKTYHFLFANCNTVTIEFSSD